ncbi:MAG: MBOAT family protein [Desulfobacteraceae bacterium]|nr:MBOAT family protein [Desulfobacteraceae bacterium]
MLFTQIEFFIFFIILIILLAISRQKNDQKIILVFASYYFYAYWDYRFLSLIMLTTITDYMVGLCLKSQNIIFYRRILLCISLFINLSILCFFKYYNFFIESLSGIFNLLNLSPGTLDLILPLGISFYTFKSISYSIDVFNKKIEPCTSFLDYALFVSFFPPLLAGPIVRASHLLPQLKTKIKITQNNILQGLRLFIFGLFLKVFIADRLGLFVDIFFENPNVFDSITTWIAVLSYSTQIYFDFAGYSSMAIGTAKMIGYDIEINFDFPYLSKSIVEFWRRWHISLSFWIRDYVYIPLGGNKLGKSRTYINLLVAMTICGLWHGAAWTFVFWGFYHGVLLMFNRIYSKTHKERPSSHQTNFTIFFNWLITITGVVIGWVFFRVDNLSYALVIIKKMFIPSPGIAWSHPFAIFIIISTLFFHIFVYFKKNRTEVLPLHAKHTIAALFCMAWLIIVFHPKGFHPFIYFQF